MTRSTTPLLGVYHRTDQGAAAAILNGGFRDGSYVMPGIGTLKGAFVSADWPVGDNEGAHGDAVIEMHIPEALFDEYHWHEEDETWRQAMIPAVSLNRHLATARLLTDDDVDELEMRRWDQWSNLVGTPPPL
jgi:hypothetical protein